MKPLEILSIRVTCCSLRFNGTTALVAMWEKWEKTKVKAEEEVKRQL